MPQFKLRSVKFMGTRSSAKAAAEAYWHAAQLNWDIPPGEEILGGWEVFIPAFVDPGVIFEQVFTDQYRVSVNYHLG